MTLSRKLNHIILHYSYSSLHQCLEKNNRYSTYSAEMAFSKGKDKSMLMILLGLKALMVAQRAKARALQVLVQALDLVANVVRPWVPIFRNSSSRTSPCRPTVC